MNIENMKATYQFNDSNKFTRDAVLCLPMLPLTPAWRHRGSGVTS